MTPSSKRRRSPTASAGVELRSGGQALEGEVLQVGVRACSRPAPGTRQMELAERADRTLHRSATARVFAYASGSSLKTARISSADFR